MDDLRRLVRFNFQIAKDDKSWICILVDGKINKALSAKYFLSK